MNNRVSVVIPTYKRASTLKRAIESVLYQTYENIEVIVVDDNSDGDIFRVETEKMMSEYEKNDKVKYVKHSHNKNGAAARNTGILNSSSEYIAFLDDDDYFLQNKIEKQINQITMLGLEWGGVSCNHVRRYKNDIYKAIKIDGKENGNYFAEFLSEMVSMPSSTLLIRRSVFDKVGLFDVQFYRHQDLEFLVRFFREFKMTFIDDFQLVMQVEGIRNLPAADKALFAKNLFINKFNSDINALSEESYKKVIHMLWLPVVGAFFQENKFKTSITLFRNKLLPNSKSIIHDVCFLLYYYLIGMIPCFKMIYAKATSFLFYRTLNKTLKNDFKLLNEQTNHPFF